MARNDGVENFSLDYTSQFSATTDEIRSVETVSNPSYLELVFEIAVYTTSAAGLFTNLLIFLIIFTDHGKFCSKPSYILLIQQAVVDFYVSALVLASYIPWFTGVGLSSGNSIWGHLYCRLLVSEFLLLTGYYANTFNITAMAIERLIMVVHPIMYHTSIRVKHMVCVCVASWLLAAMLNIHNAAMANVEQGMCIYDYAFGSKLFHLVCEYISLVLSFFAPFLLIIYCYSHMFVLIRGRTKKTKIHAAPCEGPLQESSQAEPGKFKMSKIQMNLLKVMATITVVFVVTLTPLRVYLLLYSLGMPLTFSDPSYYTATCLVVLNSSLNPFIYLFKCTDFRRQIKKIFKTDSDIGTNHCN